MYVRSRCIKVPARNVSYVLKVLKDLRRHDLKVRRYDDYVAIPILDDVDERSLKERLRDVDFLLCEDEFEEVLVGKTYKDLLAGKVPNSILSALPRAYDIIGDIAIIKIRDDVLDELLRYKELIVSAITSIAKNVKVVYAERPGLEGEFRVRKLVLLGGERRSWTIHREYGVRVFIDVLRTYYNPSLSEEHRRIALMSRDYEVIADLFTGVGPFPLHIASLRRAKVYAIDINPVAIECLLKSLNMNRLVGKVIPINSDARDFLEIVADEVFDRVIMNLPHKSLEFLPLTLRTVKVGGVIHLYTLLEEGDDVGAKVLKYCHERRCIIKDVIKVIDYAPRKYVVRVDVTIRA